MRLVIIRITCANVQIAPYWRDCETEGLSSVSEPWSYCSLPTKNCGERFSEWEVPFSSEHRSTDLADISHLHCIVSLPLHLFPLPPPPCTYGGTTEQVSQCKAAKFIVLWCKSYFVVAHIILLMFFFCRLVCLRIFWLQYKWFEAGSVFCFAFLCSTKIVLQERDDLSMMLLKSWMRCCSCYGVIICEACFVCASPYKEYRLSCE